MNPGLELVNVDCTVAGSTGFQRLCLRVGSGALFGVLGRSGAGKTTLLRLIGGHLRPEGGVIRIGGKDITQCAAEERPTATVFQRFALFPHLTVEQNVSFGLDLGGSSELTKEQTALVHQLIEELGLSDFRRRRPDQLSVGQMQRAAIARALATKPQVLLMDEPFSALDVATRNAAKELILKVRETRDVTIVIVSHDQDDLLSTCSDIAILSNFVVAQVGQPEALIQAPESPSVVAYLDGFFEVDYVPGVAKFYCHRANMRVDQPDALRNGMPAVKARVVRVSRRLDGHEVELRTESTPNRIVLHRAAVEKRLAVDARVTVLFEQQVRF